MTPKYDIIIIGAGVIGSATAMHLSCESGLRIAVIDLDLEGSLSSSELNAGGVRATWNQPINIEMSKSTIDFMAQNRIEMGYRDCGYLWLYTPEKFQSALKSRERHVAAGWPVEAWDVAELRKRVPLIDKTDDLAGALFAPRDGLVNPNLVKNYFRTKARENGVVFLDRMNFESLEITDHFALVSCRKFESSLSIDDRRDLLSGKTPQAPSHIEKFQVDRIVNCSGAWAADIATKIGYQSPSFPSRRQVSIFDCKDADLNQYGMIVDTSGVYFHPEAMNGLAGVTIPNEPRTINFDYDGETFFMEHIWAPLYERSSAFEKLKHLTGWAGQYEVSPDECAIIGKVSDRIYESHSYSGHGVMHSHAAGLGLAELMLKGKYETMDLSSLSAKRFDVGTLLHEGAVI